MPTLRISIHEDPSPTVNHRFRNFGEDVYRQFRDVYNVSIDEIDRSTTSFEIHNVKRRELRKTSEEIKRLLTRHYFTNSSIEEVLTPGLRETPVPKPSLSLHPDQYEGNAEHEDNRFARGD
ncbi:MAG: hypothetical protein ACFCU3_02160 [Verrucomicrobiales bacterium]